MSATVTRRLSARRGSTTAPDPYAKNAHLIRESSSILTIVRVSSPASHNPVHPRSRDSPLAPPCPQTHRKQSKHPAAVPRLPGSTFSPSQFRLFLIWSATPAGQPRRGPNTASASCLAPSRRVCLVVQQTTPVPGTAARSRKTGHKPALRALARRHTLNSLALALAPATFTPLPPDVYLPFLDRPAEVSALLSSPPSAKLFALLAQTFPKNKAKDDGALPHNTADWTFAHLAHWLTQTTRDEASDGGALGVPPELDVEYTEAEYHDVFESDEESGDEQGRWGTGAAITRSTTVEPSMSRTPTTDTSSSTPTLVTQLPTPAHDEYFTFSPSELAPSGSEIFIEPILASDQAILGPHPPPLSLPGDASSLGDIGEEEEDEDAAASPPRGRHPPPPPPSTPGTPLLPNAIRSATTGAPMRSPSFSARAPPHSHSPTFRSSSSSPGSLRLERSASFGSARSVGSSNSGYDPVADRAPGNPLFPSNFARLALGPTLAANNPALRSPSLPPQSRFSMGRRSSSTRSEQRGNRFRRGEEEPHYAATFASSSSAGSVRDA
ncbi:hypothetical protein C8F04DRAFT_1398284 [Mycena alexandri]|uniref:Uncharacterized protein n=1 Tax=Mycena alexandri TaxID=1745969 RepID=A0AAD6X014_9AGAR|nr:hypothetical protein C8F04DRAFT_1398284 [Mycena alexandri]